MSKEVTFCKKCVMSNQRPCSSVEFKRKEATISRSLNMGDGVCSVCKFAEIKERILWKEREEKLLILLDKHRRKDGYYDCIVPGSGGKDSGFAAHILKHKYGMHPLTITWPPLLYTDVGLKNFRSWIHAGFDNISFNYNSKVYALLTKLAIENLFHPFQPFMLGQKNLAPKIATQYNIPLIFYGEDRAEYDNPIVENTTSLMNKSYYTTDSIDSVYLSGVSVKELRERHGLTRNDIMPYLPMIGNIKSDLEFHCLGYYLNWKPKDSYEYAVKHTGFQPRIRRSEGTYTKYKSLDDKIDGFHYYTSYIKFGIGRTTYDASHDIRNKDLTRKKAVELVKRWDGEFPLDYYHEVLEHIELSPIRFRELIEKFRPEHLWKKLDGEWKLRCQVE